MSSVLKNHHIVSSDYLVEKSKSIEKIIFRCYLHGQTVIR